MALKVVVRCPHPDVAFRGLAPRDVTPEELLRDYVEKARTRGVPIHLEVRGHGAWRIAPSGKVTRETRFLRPPR
jgi:hypothetical protein